MRIIFDENLRRIAHNNSIHAFQKAAQGKLRHTNDISKAENVGVIYPDGI